MGGSAFGKHTMPEEMGLAKESSSPKTPSWARPPWALSSWVWARCLGLGAPRPLPAQQCLAESQAQQTHTDRLVWGVHVVASLRVDYWSCFPGPLPLPVGRV